MSGDTDLASEILTHIEWPENWPLSAKKDYESWLRHTVQGSNFTHVKNLQTLTDLIMKHDKSSGG